MEFADKNKVVSEFVDELNLFVYSENGYADYFYDDVEDKFHITHNFYDRFFNDDKFANEICRMMYNYLDLKGVNNYIFYSESVNEPEYKSSIKIKNLTDVLTQIKLDEGFATDGCYCGDWGYKIADGLCLYAYRSCKKSANTPDHKWWHVHDLKLYSKMNKGYRMIVWNGKEEEVVDFVEVEKEDEIKHLKLDEEQYRIIYEALRKESVGVCGTEYKAHQEELEEKDALVDQGVKVTLKRLSRLLTNPSEALKWEDIKKDE